MATESVRTWVVYRAAVHGQPGGAVAVCERREWDEMVRNRPGHHTLIRDNIPTEAEADALAREGSGYRPPSDQPNKGGRRLKLRQDWPSGRGAEDLR